VLGFETALGEYLLRSWAVTGTITSLPQRQERGDHPDAPFVAEAVAGEVPTPPRKRSSAQTTAGV
jgi:hypothetical protein